MEMKRVFLLKLMLLIKKYLCLYNLEIILYFINYYLSIILYYYYFCLLKLEGFK